MAAADLLIPSRGRGPLPQAPVLALIAILLVLPDPSSADTIYLKEKKTLKGVIVEEHADRYLLSTGEGEIPVLKALVESVKYDDPEQSYYHLGRQLQEAGRLREALAAYRKAMELRPDFQAARDAAFGLQRVFVAGEESQAMAEVRQKRLIMLQQRPSPATGAHHPETFEDRFGCRLGYEEGRTIVAGVRARSPAAVAGLEVGDRLVAIGPEPIIHGDPEQIGRRFSEARGELPVTIERQITLNTTPGQPHGLGLALGYQGLQVASVASRSPLTGQLMVGDFLVALDGRPTRYMALAAAQKLLQQTPAARLTIQRFLVLRQTQSLQ